MTESKRIIIHDDFTNFLIDTPGAENSENLAKAARRELASGADTIGLAVGLNPGKCYYSPTRVGGVLGASGQEDIHGGAVMRALIASGVDPYGLVLDQLRGGECAVLAKFRVNDCHHLTGHTAMESPFWQQHPQWRIGSVENSLGGETSFDSCACVGPMAGKAIARQRGRLLDYAVPEVREYRLAAVREFMQRYDVDGLTLNFVREPYCISFPSKNAHLLSDFVVECRKIVEETAGKRGKAAGIMGAIVPWDIRFCRQMGLEVERWIRDGLLDYVSPTDTWLSEFNMDIEPWVTVASSTHCAVCPGIIGLTSNDNDVCLPEEYEPEELEVGGRRQGSSMVTVENVRALAHGFYAQGAGGVSFFNFFSPFYHYLYPLPDLCLPQGIEGKERRYIYLKAWPLFGEYGFLQLVLSADSSERKTVQCRVYESLAKADVRVRFKARGLTRIDSLRVDVNNREVPARGMSLIPHGGEGFVYAEFGLEEGMLRHGVNEIGFTLHRGGAPGGGHVIIQELEIRVVPR